MFTLWWIFYWNSSDFPSQTKPSVVSYQGRSQSSTILQSWNLYSWVMTIYGALVYNGKLSLHLYLFVYIWSHIFFSAEETHRNLFFNLGLIRFPSFCCWNHSNNSCCLNDALGSRVLQVYAHYCGSFTLSVFCFKTIFHFCFTVLFYSIEDWDKYFHITFHITDVFYCWAVFPALVLLFYFETAYLALVLVLGIYIYLSCPGCPGTQAVYNLGELCSFHHPISNS